MALLSRNCRVRVGAFLRAEPSIMMLDPCGSICAAPQKTHACGTSAASSLSASRRITTARERLYASGSLVMLLRACWGLMSLDSLKSSPTRTTWSVTSSLELSMTLITLILTTAARYRQAERETPQEITFNFVQAVIKGPLGSTASRACCYEADPPSRPQGTRPTAFTAHTRLYGSLGRTKAESSERTCSGDPATGWQRAWQHGAVEC